MVMAIITHDTSGTTWIRCFRRAVVTIYGVDGIVPTEMRTISGAILHPADLTQHSAAETRCRAYMSALLAAAQTANTWHSVPPARARALQRQQWREERESKGS